VKGPVIFVSGLMALAVAPSAVGQTPPSADLQIRLAVQAAPAAGTNAEIRDPFLRWVIYVPNATSATTGLPEQAAGPGQPWLMFPGTPGAHIMITPPRGR